MNMQVDKDLSSARFFEDFGLGDTFAGDPVAFDAGMIVDFANRYDPQPFHTDPVQARATMFGGLISSGWQVLSETFARSLEGGFLPEGANCREITDLRWLAPVRPGDRIHLKITVQSVDKGDVLTDGGQVKFAVNAVNQSGETVMSYLLHNEVAGR